MDSPVERYLRELKHALRGNPLLARQVLVEVADHLAESVEEARRNGMSPNEAEEHAVNRFGPPEPLALQFDRFSLPLQAAVVFGSFTTAAVALWLFFVIATVLPSRDPSQIPMWRTVAIAFLCYSVLCAASLVAGARIPWLRWTVLVLSITAMALGLFGVVTELRASNTGGHFEGYLLLMGLILFGHGASAALYHLIARGIRRRVAAA